VNQGPAGDQQRRAATSTGYQERLTVAWWLWPVMLGTVLLIMAELSFGAALRSPYAYLAAAAVTAAGMLWVGRIRIRVVDGEFLVDDARLPLWAIDSVWPVEPADRRDLLGVDADPLAFVVNRPWIGGGVRVDLADPADPTPYWYVSSRHPRRLVAALRHELDTAHSADSDSTSRSAGSDSTARSAGADDSARSGGPAGAARVEGAAGQVGADLASQP
jgi:hypothetical protein